MISYWATLALKLTLALSSESPIAHGHIVRGALSDDRVYVSAVPRMGTLMPEGGGVARILRQSLTHKDRSASMFFPAGSGTSNYPGSLHRWQISRGQYHCVPLGNASGMPSYDIFRDGYVMTAPLRMIEILNKTVPGFEKRYYQVESFRWAFTDVLTNPNIRFGPVYPGRLRFSKDLVRVYFDFLPRGDERYELYVTAPDRKNRLTRWDTIPPDEYDGPVGPPPDQDYISPWRETSHWTFDWIGGFYVARSRQDRYFVTEAGKIYKAPRKVKNGSPLVEVWKGSPVRALIHDSDEEGKFYAFTKDQFFEITDPIKPRPHTIANIRGRNAKEALDAAVKCGKLIRGLPMAADQPTAASPK